MGETNNIEPRTIRAAFQQVHTDENTVVCTAGVGSNASDNRSYWSEIKSVVKYVNITSDYNTNRYISNYYMKK